MHAHRKRKFEETESIQCFLIDLRVLGASWGPLGSPVGPSWGLLGASWEPLGGFLEASWGLSGSSGSFWGACKAVLGLPWPV